MSALVPAIRVDPDTGGIKIGQPVTAEQWGAMGSLANYLNGHGGMLIPWCAIGHEVSSGGSGTFHFYVAPKDRAVQRVWCLHVTTNTAGATATITCGSASAVTVRPETSAVGRTVPVIVRESLAAKTSTAGDVSVTVSASGGAVLVESLACYEQTRRVLAEDTTDYGVELESLRPRLPIYDGTNESVAGVIDAYKNLDARRAGLFAWSTPTGSAIQITGGSYVDLFPLSPPCLGAITATGTTSTTVRCAAYAKVDSGTGQVRFTADQEGGNVVLSITSTTFAWVVDDLDINAEDLTVADGRRNNVWEGLTIEANDNTATTLEIAALAVVRVTNPL